MGRHELPGRVAAGTAGQEVSLRLRGLWLLIASGTRQATEQDDEELLNGLNTCDPPPRQALRRCRRRI
ncbi:hypothetical protein [Streptomyces sp. SID13031]|uniref:hypothetical protein n=1 Tax=Streptomyces sp. SID13031 TaxID=2706046 RepID=UPI0013CB2CBA|nr:hypothetical protein [Streptomyces sp. SID13031]NEA30344.1 hypothetical protein [Streptomyces sp. SID13031]